MSIDSIMFPLVEVALIGGGLYAAWRDKKFHKQTYEDGTSVKRGPKAMDYFYGAFGASTATLVAIPLSVEVASGFRVPLVLLNLAIPAYLCFLNAWFRNSLLSWIQWVSENVES